MTTILVLCEHQQPHNIFTELNEFYDIEIVNSVEEVFDRISKRDISLTFVPYSIFRKDPYLNRGFNIYQHPSLVYAETKDIDTPLSVIVLEFFNKMSLSYAIEERIRSWFFEKSVRSINFDDNFLDLVIEGKLLECVSHDFGNALTLILGFSDTLLDKIETDDEDRIYMENVMEAIDDAYNLVRRLISFKNLKSLSSNSEVTLLEFLEVGKKIWMKFVEKKYVINTIFQVPPNVKLSTDTRIIEYGLFHLLLKLKTFDTESISIAVYPIDYQGSNHWKFDLLAVIQKNPLEDVLISAELFSEEIKIFRRIDKSAVIEIIRDKKNSRIFISFMVEELIPQKDLASLINYIPKHIIVVDSEKEIRETLTRYFNKLGFNTSTSSDPVAALDLIKKHPTDIDAVLLDLNMEHMDLFHFQKEVRKLNSQIRLVAISGYNKLHCIDLGLLPKDMEFIQKPIDFKTLQFRFYN